MEECNLLSVTYLIRVLIEVMMNVLVMDWPVIWYFLRQAKVSHHSRAHAALPAHQAVLHRGVRGHTHVTITAVQCVGGFLSIWLHVALCVYFSSDARFYCAERFICYKGFLGDHIEDLMMFQTYILEINRNGSFLCHSPIWNDYFTMPAS